MTFGRQSDTVDLGIAENMIGFISPPCDDITCRSPTGKAQGHRGRGYPVLFRFRSPGRSTRSVISTSCLSIFRGPAEPPGAH